MEKYFVDELPEKYTSTDGIRHAEIIVKYPVKEAK